MFRAIYKWKVVVSCTCCFLQFFILKVTKRYYNSVTIVLAHWIHGSGHSMLDP